MLAALSVTSKLLSVIKIALVISSSIAVLWGIRYAVLSYRNNTLLEEENKRLRGAMERSGKELDVRIESSYELKNSLQDMARFNKEHKGVLNKEQLSERDRLSKEIIRHNLMLHRGTKK